MGDRSYRPYRQDRRRSDRYGPIKSPEEEAYDRLKSRFFAIGENRQVETSIADLAEDIVREFAMNTENISKIFRLCIYQLPLKLHYLAVLVGLINTKNSEIAAEFVKIAAELLNEGLEASSFRKVKLMVRFFGELTNAGVVEPGQAVGLLDLFLNVGEEPGVNQERIDAFVYVVMATLPFIGLSLKEKALEDFQRIYATLESFMENRQAKMVTTGIAAAHETLSVYHSKTEPYVMQDRLELLWSQIVNLKNAGWEVSILPDFIPAFSADLERQIPHEIPKITIPSSVTTVKFLYQPKFWVFDDSVNVPGERPMCHLPSTTDISRFILDDMITDTIRIFSLNHKECTLMLLKTDSLLNIDHFEREGIQIYEAIVEAIFCEMFRLPKTHERFVYYTTLIVDLCKESLDKIPSALGRSIKLIFKRLQNMDIECVKRFSEFFAIHLSNFGFSWRWSDWEFVLDQDRTSMQFVFVREALTKCIRLAFHERIKNSIPESFENNGKIFPPSPPDFTFLYDDIDKVGNPELFDLCRALSASISSRDEGDVIEGSLTEIERFVTSNPDSLSSLSGYFLTSRDGTTFAHDALFQCIMFKGSKSFSHLLNIIERYLPLLQKWNDTPEKRLLTTEITCQFWSKNPQFLEIILGKLINYRILDSKAIISWLIADATLDVHYDQFYIWAIMNSTLKKLNLRREQILQKLDKLKANPDAEAAMEDDTMENVHTLQNALEANTIEKKEVFVFCFQKFVEVLGNKMAQEGPDFVQSSYWFWVTGFMKQIAREFQPDLGPLKYTLDAIVFSDQVHKEILDIWNGIKAVYELHGEDHD